MYFIRHSITRAVAAKQSSSTVAKLQASHNAHRRTFATSSNEPADDRRTPYWIYGMVAAGAGSVLYLWQLGNQRAKAAALEEIPAHHGASSGYLTKAEGK
ncbi:uncharacterized protein N7473_011510 [Penicillium subrubescens]|uniref:uncharacterized protein n=1 Tax=Penicillium subrubescens TaxID=1316194 RepID=UPI002544FF4F|nr:uncharacterized protein N7473_011510 [Penicillium subrubescens]KAJ5880457.1 hypothetical protein N7473_011510 [Penicillium subrubescens]